MKNINLINCFTYGLTTFCALFAIFAILSLWDANDLNATEFKTNQEIETVPAVVRTPMKIGNWKYTPTVIVCENVPITRKEIAAAVDYWKKLGYRFYKTQYKEDPLNQCNERYPEGYIVFRLVTAEVLADLERPALAATTFFVEDGTNHILYAKVYIIEDPIERVLEHEIGHALGYMHSEELGHLMHIKQAKGGWNSRGLKK
tara:strand:+ start:289 stop:894 length:606 start_codon:yes stop_codon:yes gene_type:complete